LFHTSVDTLRGLTRLALYAIEEVMPQATGPVWFQLYVYKDREATLSLEQRAESHGCTAIALTMKLCGCTSVQDITEAMIFNVRQRIDDKYQHGVQHKCRHE